MNTHYLILILVTLVVIQPSTAQTSDAEAAIRKTIMQYQAGVDERDADKAADAFASKAVFMPNNEPLLEGREAIRAALKRSYAESELRGFTMTITEITVLGDLAIARTQNAGEFESPEGWQAIDTKSLFLLDRTNGNEWKIYRYMYNQN